jgi:hypothetical protein
MGYLRIFCLVLLVSIHVVCSSDVERHGRILVEDLSGRSDRSITASTHTVQSRRLQSSESTLDLGDLNFNPVVAPASEMVQEDNQRTPTPIDLGKTWPSEMIQEDNQRTPTPIDLSKIWPWKAPAVSPVIQTRRPESNPTQLQPTIDRQSDNTERPSRHQRTHQDDEGQEDQPVNQQVSQPSHHDGGGRDNQLNHQYLMFHHQSHRILERFFQKKRSVLCHQRRNLRHYQRREVPLTYSQQRMLQ